MKIFFIFSIFLCFLHSCNSTNTKAYGNNPPNEEQLWIEAYKSESFIACLGSAYGNAFDSLNFVDTSSSTNTEIIGMNMSNQADSIGTKIGSTNFFNEGDFAGKKPIINNCLQYYNSEELNSLAKKAYKVYKKRILNR